MPASDLPPLPERLTRRPLAGPIFGIAFCGLLLGFIVWVVSGWLNLPRAFIPSVGICFLLFVLFERRVRRRTAAMLAPAVDALVRLAADLDEVDAGHHRGLPYISGKRGERSISALVEWVGGERLRLVVTAHGEHDLRAWFIARGAEDLPHKWMDQLRTKRLYSPVEGLPPAITGLAPEPDRIAALWAEHERLSAVIAPITVAMPRACAIELHDDGASWDGPADAPGGPPESDALRAALDATVDLAAWAEATAPLSSP